MTTAPRGGFDSSSGGVGGGSGSISGLCAAAQSSMADPSILFDLDDFMMATDCGSSCNSNDMLPPSLVSIHAPIKEEPEFDNDDHRYLHSPIGLPIPRRNNHPQQNGSGGGNVSGGTGVGSSGMRSSKIQGADVLLSPTTTMWSPACATSTQRINVPFPATPFNTPSQGVGMATAPDFRNLFLTNSDPLAIKEEMPDIDDTDLESVTMKAVSMFPMEEDDIFLVDKADLIGFSQGPTLAELNASEESLLNDLNFDDFILPSHHQQQQMLYQQQQQQQQQPQHSFTQNSVTLGGNVGPFRNKTFSVMSDSVDPDRFRMNDLNAAFAASPSLSSFELLRARNLVITPDDECLSQLSSTQMGFDLEQLQTVAMTDVTPIPTSSTAMEVTTTPTSLLSASLPANIGGAAGGGSQLSKLTRRTEEGGRVKPPPPYPTSPPQKNNSSALQELLSLRSPSGRLPSPNPGTVGRHSPSPTANTASSLQRPTHLMGGARQRTVSHTAASSPSPAGPSGTAGTPGTAQTIPKSPSLAATNPLLLARLSSSAPAPSLLTSASVGECSTTPSAWQRREPRNRLLSTSSLVEVGEVHGSTSSISTVGVGGILSPASFDFSHDEGFDSEEDSDHYEDFDDSDSDCGGSDDEGGRGEPRASGSGSSGMSKKERFFWQYNVQAKGPKGQKISLTPETVDPHVLNEVQDPVFSPYCSVDGIKHSGKARRGDGNDLTPNPRKLHNIGRELDKLNRLINDMTPVSELPMAVRPKSRKEKNKLASRACRLKKKAQHEANKVKLYGLEQEHRKLMNGLFQAKSIMASKYESMSAQQPHAEATVRFERIYKASTKVKIAGHSTDFVNKVLERVKGGEPSGGLDEL